MHIGCQSTATNRISFLEHDLRNIAYQNLVAVERSDFDQPER